MSLAINNSTTSHNAALLGARLLLAAMFILGGIGKFAAPDGTIGMIQGAGLPAAALLNYVAAVFELLAGAAIIIGFRTRLAALALALFCVFTALVFHNGAINVPGFPDAANGYLTVLNGLIFWKNLAAAGGFLALAAAGAGAWSLDARRT